MSRHSRRQSNQPFPQYGSVPQTPSRANSANSAYSYAAYQAQQQQQVQPPTVYVSQIGGPRPIRSSSVSSRPRRSSSSRQSHQQQGRHDMAMGVATGNIGAGYGPYSVRLLSLININVFVKIYE